MINLIPPQARVKVIYEYWTRVVSVWLFLFGTVAFIIALLLFPVLVLVSVQTDLLKAKADEATARVSSFDASAAVLIEANNQATLLKNAEESVAFSDLVKSLETKASNLVAVKEIVINQSEGSAGQIRLSGEAPTRQSLASYRDLISVDPIFKTVDLPISNLAKEKDLQFSMSITLASSTPTI